MLTLDDKRLILDATYDSRVMKRLLAERPELAIYTVDSRFMEEITREIEIASVDLSFLEKMIKESPTGVSFDYVPSVDGEPSGFRFMRHRYISKPRPTLKEAILASQSERLGLDHMGKVVVRDDSGKIIGRQG